LSTALPILSDVQSQTAARQSSSPPPALRLDPRTYDRGLACVHCGLCLPACPTYTQDGHEADSPRGRIMLMLGLAEGKIQPTASVRHHLDLCLDCRGCETACPSGVVYHELIEETRSKLAGTAPLSGKQRLLRWVFFHVFTRPTRLKLALLPARVLQRLGLYFLLRKSGMFRLLPLEFRKMEQMLPARGRLWPAKLPARIPARPLGDPKGVSDAAPTAVGFLPGCIGSVMFDRVNRQAVELLAACGADVVVPPAQGCCGAIHHHNGAHHEAEEMARRNIDAFLPAGAPGVRYIVTTIAGCGAMLREYDFLLRDDPKYAGRAKEFASRVRDISEVLAELGLPGMAHPVNETVTYHDACHLAHAQRVTAQPRALLARIPELKLIPLPESDVCCGAAGTYNLSHPQMASDLAERKLRNIASTGAATCATGNLGCAMHIGSEATARGQDLRIVHPVELLHRAVFGELRG
jgi:glycolate oxidase iron-sulfur subunit